MEDDRKIIKELSNGLQVIAGLQLVTGYGIYF